jgi:hypothetical protein
MPTKRIHISAVTVQCSEAIDWEIVQVTFDTEASDFDEENRTSEYLLLSANFEFGNDVQIEFYDGDDYGGDCLEKMDLWRDRAIAVSVSGVEFDLRFDLSDDAFCELREHLKVLLRYDSFRA